MARFTGKQNSKARPVLAMAARAGLELEAPCLREVREQCQCLFTLELFALILSTRSPCECSAE